MTSQKPSRSQPALSRGVLPLGINTGDSVSMAGMRGAGKTVLATGIYKRAMDRSLDVVGYVIDSNRGGDFTGWSGGYIGTTPPLIRPGKKGRQLVWQPNYDSFDMYEDFFGRLYQYVQDYGFEVVLWIDELSALRGGDNHPNYATLLKRGRRRSKFAGITTITLSQEMAQKADTPRQAFTQAVHFIKFSLQHRWDLALANDLLGLPPKVQPPHEHGFWHANLTKPPIHARYYKGSEQVL